MYIRPKLLWWLIPTFLGLFLLGIALGSAGNKYGMSETAFMDQQKDGEHHRVALSELLDQLTEDKERSFIVYLQESALNGRYQHERFELKGEVGGHNLEMSRNLEQPVAIRIDGQIQNEASLPYALYTPYEHAALIKKVLQSVKPQSIQDPGAQGLYGYRLAVPAEEVTALLSMWLGPSFPIHDMPLDVAKGIGVDYQLWYDSESKQIRQLELQLRMQTAAGVKQDQLRFRL
ncbi:hypothetical protein [Brevibacillus sp. NRS-1366]|uniref:hypothetical protein n=1 Tax=Brevibacillus sp. NRS-1366 TaxID=3233899 RepID=UPI003D24CB98